MFWLKKRNITIFMIIATLILWANVGITQTEWEKYPGNPVLDLGEYGTWDAFYTITGGVLFDGTKYKMWYTGSDVSTHRIGYATSFDGIVWEKHPANPVLDVGANGTWDDASVDDTTVLYDGSKYQMWYQGHDGSNRRIGYATSFDGIVWEKYPANPVLDLGAPGTWEDSHVGDPNVLFDGTQYHMWYGGNGRIGYATSFDGIVWEKYPDNPVLDLGAPGTWDDASVGTPTVLFDGTKYQMWYTGSDVSKPYPHRIGYATSFDGIVWETHPANPVLDVGPIGTWEDWYVGSPIVLFDGTQYQMWYKGYHEEHSQGHWRIGYATSIPGSPTITIKTDKSIYNPWDRVQVLADVDNPGESFSAKLLGGVLVFRTSPKKPLFLSGDVITKTIDPGFNPNIALYVSKPAITGLLAAEATHGAFGILYTDDGLMGFDISTWGLKGPPSVAEEKLVSDLILSYIQRYGIENLQHAKTDMLLPAPATNVPFKNALGRAFPSVANPETWFPFQLSESAEVTIKIHNSSGQLVKTLNLGYKQSGHYLNKAKAAFWDGRNDRGERVASGIYFYTMQTRNYTATGKVVILK